ncbi:MULTISPECIES: glyoxalase/bleomycin resistance/dioxygenase family protein [unclassified Alteromonas]|uniref:glyoxalase/bleomycin resistance/dioxygenase family protein n=1 Tax=unclassified Alteromonas TaxID=2614992 RepID=UPI00068DECC9|nr:MULTISPECIES: glyoxalase/bleomycin resistance/dioxygenase family protein [unclassified Alteromonas]
MAGPAHHGAIIYSNNLKNLSAFYVQLFSMKVVRETADFISLDKDGFNLIIHIPPFAIPHSSVSAVKLFFAVTSIENAKSLAIKLGGEALDGEWANPMFIVANIVDNEGNHIQIREFARNPNA